MGSPLSSSSLSVFFFSGFLGLIFPVLFGIRSYFPFGSPHTVDGGLLSEAVLRCHKFKSWDCVVLNLLSFDL